MLYNTLGDGRKTKGPKPLEGPLKDGFRNGFAVVVASCLAAASSSRNLELLLLFPPRNLTRIIRLEFHMYYDVL